MILDSFISLQAPLESYPNHMTSAYRIIIACPRKTFFVIFGQLILKGHKMIKDSFIVWQAPKKVFKVIKKRHINYGRYISQRSNLPNM